MSEKPAESHSSSPAAKADGPREMSKGHENIAPLSWPKYHVTKLGAGQKESQQVFFATKKKRWTLRNPVITLLLKRERKERHWRTNYCHWQPFKAVKKPHSPSTSVFDCSFALVAPHG